MAENKAKTSELRAFIRYCDISLEQLRKQAYIGELGESEYIRNSIMELELDDCECEIVRDLFNELAYRIILEKRYNLFDKKEEV